MNPEATKALEVICKKEVHELTEYDKGFLRARVSYLTPREFEKYESVFETHEDNTLIPVEPAEPKKVVKNDGLKEFHELQKQAKALGIDTRGLNKEQLKDAILSKS